MFSSEGATASAPIEATFWLSKTGSKGRRVLGVLPDAPAARGHKESVEMRFQRRLGDGDVRTPRAGAERSQVAILKAVTQRDIEPSRSVGLQRKREDRNGQCQNQ